MKTKFLLFGMFLSLMTISCTKDSLDNTTITAEEATVSSKLDIMSDDVTKVVEDQLGVQDGVTGRGSQGYLPDCAIVTRVPVAGTVLLVGDLITKTIDFGTTGCAMPNGNVLKGKIIMSFTYQPGAISHTVNYSFVDFYHNAVKIEGSKTFTRTMTNNTAVSHPIVTMDMDLTATFPNGKVYTRVGTRVREIIEGYATVGWADNIYKVTGSWTTTFPNTVLQTSTITTPLIVKISCAEANKPLLVKGVITFVRNNHTATLDYGNGDCDNIAIFTINGVSHTILIGN